MSAVSAVDFDELFSARESGHRAWPLIRIWTAGKELIVKKSLPTRVLPKHPDLDQLKRQAKELLDAVRAGEPDAVSEAVARYPGADLQKFALHDAQLVLARAHGFHSWPRLKAYVSGGMIKPPEMESDLGRDVWDTITAAA